MQNIGNFGWGLESCCIWLARMLENGFIAWSAWADWGNTDTWCLAINAIGKLYDVYIQCMAILTVIYHAFISCTLYYSSEMWLSQTTRLCNVTQYICAHLTIRFHLGSPGMTVCAQRMCNDMLALIAFKVKLFQSASTIQIKYTANSLAMALSCFNIKTFLCVVQKLQCYPIHLCPLPYQFSKLSDCLVPEECALTTMTNGFDSLQGQNLPLCITEIDFLHLIHWLSSSWHPSQKFHHTSVCILCRFLMELAL